MRRTMLVSLLAASLLVFSCTPSSPSQEPSTEDLDEFLRLQEQIIEAEELDQDILQQNIDLGREHEQISEQVLELSEELGNQTRQKLSPPSHPSEESKEVEHPSPKDWVSEDQIQIQQSRVVLDVKGVEKYYIFDTNSMDPLLDEGATILTAKPQDETDITVGDILVYQHEMLNVVHRVAKIGQDEQGMYYITKGDNNLFEDDVIIRFDNISAVVIGILY